MELTGSLPASSVVETEHIPYLLTEKGTLVFTIAPNGHVWGHRIEDGGTKRDIELEVYAPVEDGYTLRRKNGHTSSGWALQSDLTESQKKAIRFILAQKSLYGVLGALVVSRGWFDGLDSHYKTHNEHHGRLLSAMNPNLCVVDCSDLHDKANKASRAGLVSIEYSDDKFAFYVSTMYYGVAGGATATKYSLKQSYRNPNDDLRWNKTSVQKLDVAYREGYRVFEKPDAEFPQIVFSAAQARDGKFFVGSFPACVERSLFPNEIIVLCDTENIFDVLDIDDALLLLEERRISEKESELYWTFAIAHNKMWRELDRIKSNHNPASRK